MKYLVPLFVVGSVVGYIIEVIFKRLVSKKKWINPGFMKGPYLPIYGFGLIILYGISSINFFVFGLSKFFEIISVILAFAIILTILELFSGYIFLKGFNLRLWDYSNEKLNFKGLICLKYSLYWTILGVTYYFLLHPLFNLIVNAYQNTFILKVFTNALLIIIIVDALDSFKVTKKLSKFANVINKEVSNIIAYYKIN